MRAPTLRVRWPAAALAAVLALAGCASDGTWPPEHYEARLTGAQEQPPVQTAASGHAEVAFDPRTHMLRWRITHQGLSGPLVAARMHGPAAPGQAGPAVLPLGNPHDNPLAGQVRLTPEQATQLQSGHWYVNLATSRHPGGELRGQLRPRP